MESKNQQNQFNNPVIIILFVVVFGLIGYIIFSKNQNNTQPVQEAVNSQQQTTDNSQPTAPIKQPAQSNTTKSTSQIVQEWRKTTALVFCQYGTIGYDYREVSGSGLLVNLNGKPQVITNGHVVNNSRGNLDSCWIKFPDQTGVSTYNVRPQSITYDSSGYDVAYLDLSEYSQQDIHTSEGIAPISERARSDSYLCKNNPSVGDHILILGYPVYGTPISLSRLYSSNPIEVTATEGIISGKDGIYFTTSAKIDSGNSGGLSIDAQNDCYFGIPTWNESGNFESLGRILPASTFLHY